MSFRGKRFTSGMNSLEWNRGPYSRVTSGRNSWDVVEWQQSFHGDEMLQWDMMLEGTPGLLNWNTLGSKRDSPKVNS